MALGNWATLALKLDGTPINTVDTGWLTSPAGVLLDIRKNWLNAHDGRAWREGAQFVSPVVLYLEQGRLSYLDWTINAIRGPQQGIYVVAYWTNPDRTINGFVGCGVYGYGEEGWLGVTPASVEFLRNWVTAKEPLPTKAQYEDLIGVREGEAPQAEFDEWLAAYGDAANVFPEDVANVPWDKVVSINQGSAFFARNIPKVLDGTYDPEKV